MVLRAGRAPVRRSASETSRVAAKTVSLTVNLSSTIERGSRPRNQVRWRRGFSPFRGSVSKFGLRLGPEPPSEMGMKVDREPAALSTYLPVLSASRLSYSFPEFSKLTLPFG